MARLRTIKPEFWSSEQVMELSLVARLAFVGMWNFCDDNGVHPASAKTLKAEVFPSDEITIDAVSALVAEMVAQGLVQEYEAAGKRYWRVTGWKHQYIKHPAVKYPLPDGIEQDAFPPAGGHIPPGRGESGGNAPTGRHPEKEKERKRKGEEKDKTHRAPAAQPRGASLEPDGFDRFWSIWPNRVAKASAEKAWRKLGADPALQAAILAAVERQSLSEAWRKDGGAYIPHAATWLNGRRWEDELEPAAAAYAADEIEVMTAYNADLGERGWPSAAATPFSADRAAAIREFLGFGAKPGWVEAYFAWLGQTLPPKEGFGFDWVIQRGTYLRAKEGNFAALREAA